MSLIYIVLRKNLLEKVFLVIYDEILGNLIVVKLLSKLWEKKVCGNYSGLKLFIIFWFYDIVK